MNILEIPLIARIRRNHALEHATIHVLTQRNPRRPLTGRTTTHGFYLFGDMETGEVAAAVSEALVRLQRGEHSLAVHPRCGTNLATAGVLAGLFSFAAMSGRSKSRLTKLPQVILAATIAVMAAQPLGLALQKHVTTLPEVEGVTIEKITRQQRGRVVVHEVKIKGTCHCERSEAISSTRTLGIASSLHFLAITHTGVRRGPCFICFTARTSSPAQRP